MVSPARTTSEGSIRLWDGILAFWVVLWLVVGAWTGYEIWQLRILGQSTVESGQSLQAAAAALAKLSSVPLIGNVTGDLGQHVSATADGIVKSGNETYRSVEALAITIGLAVAFAPSAPVMLLYLPTRWARGRDVRQLRRALNDRPGSPELAAYLAARAVNNLSVGKLLAVSADPRGDLAGGRHEALASAELARLGIRRASHDS